MALRRGFKAEANATAREVRAELGLAAYEPLCPFAVIEHLGVPTMELSKCRDQVPDAVDYLSADVGNIRLSAMTACFGSKKLLIYNDSLPMNRVNADIMHEAAHLLLMHPPHGFCSEDGGRIFIPEMEEEANWLGPALLVSEEAAVHVARTGESIGVASKRFGASESLMRMRLNVTGAFRRARRSAAFMGA